jgi:hypothetical protein
MAKHEWHTSKFGRSIRIMARVEGYVMLRHKGCTPFTVPEKEIAEFIPALERDSTEEPSREGDNGPK